jgi:hypothetical protein
MIRMARRQPTFRDFGARPSRTISPRRYQQTSRSPWRRQNIPAPLILQRFTSLVPQRITTITGSWLVAIQHLEAGSPLRRHGTTKAPRRGIDVRALAHGVADSPLVAPVESIVPDQQYHRANRALDALQFCTYAFRRL